MAEITFLDRLLNFVIPIAAILFFGAVLYRAPAIRESVNLVAGWIKSLFTKAKEKTQEKIEDEAYSPR